MGETIRLGDMCDVITKGTTPNAKMGGFSEQGVNYIKSESLNYDGYIDQSKFVFVTEEINAKLKRSQLKSKDVLLSIAGANLGKCGLVTEDMLPANTNQAVAIIRVNSSKASPEFVHYFLRNPRMVLANLAGVAQSAQPNLNLGDISNFQLPALPLPEQRAIAAVLSALDDKIALNRRMNETLEGLARALFKDWFVGFGPTRAKASGAKPDLPPETLSLFPDRLDDNGLPEGWEVSEIGKETKVVGGSTPSTKEPRFWGGGIHWTTPKDLSALKSPVLFETNRTITEAGLEKISSGLLPVGTVLLSSRAPIGYVAIAAVPVAVNQGYIALRCEGRLSNVYVWLWLHENMEAIKGNANGSTFQEISKKNFRPLPVVVPSADVMDAFNEMVMPLYERIEKNELESRTLAQTRDLLLPKLMSGALRVGAAGKIVEGAL